MHQSTFDGRLRDRAASISLDFDPSVLPALHVFYELLAKWNARINLTALPLDDLPDRTVDRLFMEPLAAAPLLLNLPGSAWFDIGSGSGSPAVPMAVVRTDLRLVMTESRARKASFLREVVRELDLSAEVEARRFDQVADVHQRTAALVTARGVRLDDDLLGEIRRIAVEGGVVAIFGSHSGGDLLAGLQRGNTYPLVDAAHLHTYVVSRGTTR